MFIKEPAVTRYDVKKNITAFQYATQLQRRLFT